VEIVHCRDAGNGWLDVEAAVDGRRYGWFEHKSHLDTLRTREECFEYLGDQAVGLADANFRPN
jgi:hypothetical protein